ncbi:hypothetical protein TNCV_2503371 [Trichonephila clavipes]|nr:hypothetical protein TNCV_2503371 [Trichonephila clavipes]
MFIFGLIVPMYAESYDNRLTMTDGQNITAEKTVAVEVRSLMEKCPACCVLIGRDRSTQKVSVEKDWVDPKINDPKQGDLGIKNNLKIP